MPRIIYSARSMAALARRLGLFDATLLVMVQRDLDEPAGYSPAVSRYSHAGGVVARTVAGEREYLLVEARRSRGEWVLPKGHIEPGETPEAAAVREVEEEAGVCAEVVARAGESEYAVDGQTVRVIFFLMRYQGEARRQEARARAWRRYEDALRLLRFDDTRRVLTQAHALQL